MSCHKICSVLSATFSKMLLSRPAGRPLGRFGDGLCSKCSRGSAPLCLSTLWCFGLWCLLCWIFGELLEPTQLWSYRSTLIITLPLFTFAFAVLNIYFDIEPSIDYWCFSFKFFISQFRVSSFTIISAWVPYFKIFYNFPFLNWPIMMQWIAFLIKSASFHWAIAFLFILTIEKFSFLRLSAFVIIAFFYYWFSFISIEDRFIFYPRLQFFTQVTSFTLSIFPEDTRVTSYQNTSIDFYYYLVEHFVLISIVEISVVQLPFYIHFILFSIPINAFVWLVRVIPYELDLFYFFK